MPLLFFEDYSCEPVKLTVKQLNYLMFHFRL